MRPISFKIQGHADRIVLADTNFPTASICGEGTEGPRQVRAVLLEAILQLLPLDTYVYTPVMLMDLVNKDKNSGMPEPPVWATYQGLLDSSEGKKVRLLLINHHPSPQTT